MNIHMHRGIPNTLTVFPGKTIILLRMLDWQIPGQFFLRSWTFRVHFNGKTAIQISCSSGNVPSILGSSWLDGMARNPVYILSTMHCYSKKTKYSRSIMWQIISSFCLFSLSCNQKTSPKSSNLPIWRHAWGITSWISMVLRLRWLFLREKHGFSVAKWCSLTKQTWAFKLVLLQKALGYEG